MSNEAVRYFSKLQRDLASLLIDQSSIQKMDHIAVQCFVDDQRRRQAGSDPALRRVTFSPHVDYVRIVIPLDCFKAIQKLLLGPALTENEGIRTVFDVALDDPSFPAQVKSKMDEASRFHELSALTKGSGRAISARRAWADCQAETEAASAASEAQSSSGAACVTPLLEPPSWLSSPGPGGRG